MANLKRDRLKIFKQYVTENKSRKTDYICNKDEFERGRNLPWVLSNPV